ncbi:isochorismatase family protein [Nocardia sp. KC 131]|uniref:isochorismatase family protein n=1 Tax=Nocardia arseniciresistens TaxID=3392119 RepID=UPI00398E3E87
MRGGELAQVVDQLSSGPNDFIVEKNHFSAFYNTNPDDLLRGHDCDHIYLIGYSADVCLRFTAVAAV